MKTLFFTLLFIVIFSISSVAGSLTLAWDPNPEPDLSGYNLYYWEEGTAVEQFVDVGNLTTFKLTGLTTAKYYIIEVTAYDSAGNESDRSYRVSDKAKFTKVENLVILP